MTHKLPPNLLNLFAPRPALRYLIPSDHPQEERKTHHVTGVAQLLPALEEYKEVPYEPTESWFEKKIRVKAEKKERQEQLLKQEPLKDEDPQVRGDAFKTLFISRLSYDVTEKDLEREFGKYGAIERIRVVTDTHEGSGGEGKPKKKKKKSHRGYAFVVYERERDMKEAYKATDGIMLKGRKILVDVERGRTVKGWRPRRLGGGLGGRGYTRAPARGPTGFAAPAGPGYGGGFRGGFAGPPRGGFRGGFRGGDRGGYNGGRGGIGYQGGGGFGGRGGYGGGAASLNAPSGPAGMNGGPPMDSRGGYGDPRRSSSYRGGVGGYPDGRSGAFTGSNSDPIRPREFGGYGDRDQGGRRREDDYSSRKRYHESDGYDDPRSKRRY